MYLQYSIENQAKLDGWVVAEPKIPRKQESFLIILPCFFNIKNRAPPATSLYKCIIAGAFSCHNIDRPFVIRDQELFLSVFLYDYRGQL